MCGPAVVFDVHATRRAGTRSPSSLGLPWSTDGNRRLRLLRQHAPRFPSMVLQVTWKCPGGDLQEHPWNRGPSRETNGNAERTQRPAGRGSVGTVPPSPAHRVPRSGRHRLTTKKLTGSGEKADGPAAESRRTPTPSSLTVPYRYPTRTRVECGIVRDTTGECSTFLPNLT